MPDMIDAAQEAEETFNAAAISCRIRPAPIVHYSTCQWCGVSTPPEHGKFCSADCREDSDKSARLALSRQPRGIQE